MEVDAADDDDDDETTGGAFDDVFLASIGFLGGNLYRRRSHGRV